MDESGGRDSNGFTLVELLIVIVILGILATVAVFAVTGIGSQGEASACATDNRTVVGAEEAYMAEHGQYGAMTDLVSGGRLRSESNLFTVSVNPLTDAYTLTGVGKCVGYVPPGGGSPGGGSPGGGGGAGSVTGVADTITFAGMPALSYAAPGATETVVIIANGHIGGGPDDALDDFQGLLVGPPKPGVNVVLVDLATAVDSSVVADEAAAVDAIIATNPALIASYFGDHGGQTAAALIARHQFAIGASHNVQWGINSVLGYYDDFKMAEAGGTAVMYGGIPSVRIGSATAAHQIVVLPYGTGGDDVKAQFPSLASLPPDVSVTMVGLAQAESSGVLYPEWLIDAVLAQHPDLVAARSDMAVHNTGSGPTDQDIGDYVSDNSASAFAVLHSGLDLDVDIASIISAKGWA